MTAKREPSGKRVFIPYINKVNDSKRQTISYNLAGKHRIPVSYYNVSKDLHKESVKFNSKVEKFNRNDNRSLFYKRGGNLYHIKYVLGRDVPTSRKAIIEAKELLEKASRCDDLCFTYYATMQCADIATPDEKLIYEALLEERKNLLKEKRRIQAKYKAEMNAFIKSKMTEIIEKGNESQLNESQLIEALRNKGYVVRRT